MEDFDILIGGPLIEEHKLFKQKMHSRRVLSFGILPPLAGDE
jgi:hypothetical protein